MWSELLGELPYHDCHYPFFPQLHEKNIFEQVVAASDSNNNDLGCKTAVVAIVNDKSNRIALMR
jgi:hypothetical protein